MSRPDDLLPGIRQKILDGTLPKQNCHVTWYGHGTGQICVACERPIAADDVEVECDLPGGGLGGRVAQLRGVSRRWTTTRSANSRG